MNVESGYAEVNGTKLYYEIAGSGQSILFVHGWGFDRRSWNYQFDEYSKQYRGVRYDQRGFGRSAEPVSGEEYSHSEDLRALMDYLDIEKAHLIGHSFGGRHVTILTVLHPERVQSLILADGALPGYPGSEDSAELMKWISETWRLGREVGAEAAKEMFFNGAPEGVLNHALSNPKSASIIEEMKRDYSGYNWTIDNNHVEPQIIDRLGEIKAPTLVIVAELNPKFYHDAAEYQHKHIPESKIVKIKGAGHGLMLENPEDFNREVLSFLESLR
ncbi:MAG: alpha/beta fold hydrolase [Candidatus Thorarchaeota archaeon]|jgi:pimeloyl-ACP methyl ester carboxylesterase